MFRLKQIQRLSYFLSLGLPGFGAFGVLTGLLGDVQADFFGPGSEELVVDGTGVAVADGVEVEAGDGEHTDRGAGEPGFGGFTDVVGFDVGFLDGDV